MSVLPNVTPSSLNSFDSAQFEGITHLFFDLDDTLWDFKGNAYIAHQIMYEKYELERWFDSFDSYFTIYSPKNLELWRQYTCGEITKEFLSVERFAYPLRQVGAPESFASSMAVDFLHYTTEQNRLLPDAMELLRYVRTKYTLSIISNGFCEVQYKKLRKSGLEPFFAHVVLSEDVGSLKPNKAIYEYALKVNGITPCQALMIGDSYNSDIVGARNAGISALFFNPHRKEVPDDVPQFFALKELLDVL